jgi:hypothetical protein
MHKLSTEKSGRYFMVSPYHSTSKHATKIENFFYFSKAQEYAKDRAAAWLEIEVSGWASNDFT